MTPIPDDEFERTIVVSGRAPVVEQAPDVVGHYLVVTEGAAQGTRVELDTAPVTIGRDTRQTLALADTGISRLHARVSLVQGQALVEDLGSTNGTFVDGQRVTGPAKLGENSVLRLGTHVLKYERRSRRDVERAANLDRELQVARDYVLALLPPPIEDGPVRANWRFEPSTQLGGDAFGYDWLDPDTFAFYLLDVAGHGVGSAMYSVSVLNVLRQRVLPEVNFGNPGSVLSSLNNRFQMESHNGLLFTIWYGVYRVRSRTLAYGSAGHHQAYLVPADKSRFETLGARSLMIGAMPDVDYQVQEVAVPEGSSLHLFSDGVFEIVTTSGDRWDLVNFEPLLVEPAVAGMTESERLYQAVRHAAAPGPLHDDASLMVLTFT